MIGPRRLVREAERARAFMRRLERTLEPARLVASGLPGWAIVRADERITPLVNPVDPFERLAPVLARMAKPAEAEDREARIVRRLDGGAHAVGGRRESVRPDVATRERRAVRLAHRATGDGRSPAIVTPEPAAVSQLVPGSSLAVARFEREPPGNRPIDAVPPAFESDIKSEAESRIRSEAESAVTADARTDVTSTSKRELESRLTASRAADVFVARMRASNTLQAFRSPILVEASAPLDRGQPSSIVPAAWMPPPSTPRIDAASLTASPEGARSDGEERRSRPPDAERSSSDRRLEKADAPSRAPAIPAALGTSGLRRLAALATESLAAPDPIGVGPVQPSPRVPRLDEELDRLLRAEALSHGIDADGLVR